MWMKGAASTLNRGRVVDGRDIGMVTSYSSRSGNRTLTFAPIDEGFSDQDTGSTWNIFGEAVAGPIEG